MCPRFTPELWRHDGPAAWYFVTLPFDVADEIEETSEHRGFGSVRVEVTIGATTWRTSVFPDTARRSYLLPVKRQVREAESLHEGGPVELTVEVVDAPS